MDTLYKDQKCKGITKMNIWKVKLDYDEINNFSTEDDIKNHGRGITGFDSLVPTPISQFRCLYFVVDKVCQFW
ncbi:hypothetical protein RclHR1_00180003 [Rhizophagus clarus]|uniref:Uncharacterized protein n=1 Tax=Rhizophagus clarus TaxID=94130 RepID=A0A2Z6QMR4_9GLOM|nr:hypothetical protein RclHR1_00180003 [Rhizophagus clarus]